MSIDVEYAIKKDIRNNPVIRELDTEQKREFRRIVWLACLSVAVVLFAAWQHFSTINHNMRIERLRVQRTEEEQINRKLRLNLETLRAPDLIEQRARQELGLVPPSIADTMVVERVKAATPPKGLVAEAR